MKRTTSRASELGMTLIEIMVVVAIIGLLMAAVAVVAYRKFTQSQVSVTRQSLSGVRTALATYALDNHGHCPPTLSALVDKGVVRKLPKDAWGNLIRFRCPPDHDKGIADIWSKGPDGKEGTTDDITSWRDDDRHGGDQR